MYHDISADRGDIRGDIKYDVYVYIYMILSKIDQPVTVDVSPLPGYIWDPYALTHYIWGSRKIHIHTHEGTLCFYILPDLQIYWPTWSH